MANHDYDWEIRFTTPAGCYTLSDKIATQNVVVFNVLKLNVRSFGGHGHR